MLSFLRLVYNKPVLPKYVSNYYWTQKYAEWHVPSTAIFWSGAFFKVYKILTLCVIFVATHLLIIVIGFTLHCSVIYYGSFINLFIMLITISVFSVSGQ
jgi:hypothetical protein